MAARLDRRGRVRGGAQRAARGPRKGAGSGPAGSDHRARRVRDRAASRGSRDPAGHREESIRVPLIIRGPGVPAGKRVTTIAANIDLAPTILDVAGATAGVTLDGRSLIPIANDPAPFARGIVVETGPRQSDAWYAGIRSPRWSYIEHSTGELELCDLRVDPFQLTSVHDDPRYAATRAALASRLTTLRTCAGDVCRQWTPVPGPE